MNEVIRISSLLTLSADHVSPVLTEEDGVD